MSWEELRKEWEKYNENLSKLPILEEEQIRRVLNSKTAFKLNVLILYKLFFALSLGYIGIWLMVDYKLFIYDYRYLLPFIILFIIYFGSSAFYFYRVHAIYKIKKNRNTYDKKDFIKIITTLQLFEKWEWVITLGICCPLLLICAPIVISKVQNDINFYENIDSYIPGIIFSAVVSIIPAFFLYRRTCKWINRIGI